MSLHLLLCSYIEEWHRCKRLTQLIDNNNDGKQTCQAIILESGVPLVLHYNSTVLFQHVDNSDTIIEMQI